MFHETYLIESPRSKTEVVVGSSLPDTISDRLDRAGVKCVFVSSGLSSASPDLVDMICDHIHGKAVIVSDGEAHKNLVTYEQLIEHMLGLKITRRDAVAYIGGGTLGDLTGLVSSTYKRGVSLVAVPTTLLSMIDASIGGKNGVDTSSMKNAIGTFHHPSLVIADTDFLKTGGSAQKWGIVELLKTGLVLDSTIVQDLDSVGSWNDLLSAPFLEELIAKGIRAKMSVVRSDPSETAMKREILNFGHTVGHAIELATSYSVPHGQAVLTGMIIESRITSTLFPEGVNLEERITRIASSMGLKPFQIKESILPTCADAVLQDKKMHGDELTVQILLDEGKGKNVNVSLESFMRAFHEVFR